MRVWFAPNHADDGKKVRPSEAEGRSAAAAAQAQMAEDSEEWVSSYERAHPLVGLGCCCSPRHPPRFEPSSLELNGIR